MRSIRRSTRRLDGLSGLVGRGHLVEELAAAVDGLHIGDGGTVIVEGPAGIGKTTLVDAFLGSRDDIHAVLWVDATESERLVDYGLVDQFGDDLVDFELPRPEPAETGRRLLARWRALSADGPVVVVIDDIHWADQWSRHALGFISHRLHGLSVLIVAIERTDVPAVERFGDITPYSTSRQLPVPPLTVDETQQLVERRLETKISPRAAARLHAHSGGVPILVEAVTNEVDIDDLEGLGPLPAPRRYTALVTQRFGQRTAAAQDLVTLVAVAGQPVEIATLAAQLAVDDLGAALTEAVEAELVQVEVRSGLRLVDVAHPLIRSAVVESLNPARRASAHRRAAASSSDPLKRVLHELRGVVGRHEHLGHAAIALARDRLESGWELGAIELLIAAADVLPGGPHRTDALLTAAEALLEAGESQLAATILQRTADRSPRAELLAGQLAMLDGDPGTAGAHLHRAWTEAAEDDIAARAAATLATIAANAADGPAALDWADRALERAPDRDIAGPRTMIVTGYAFLGALDRAADVLALDDPNRLSAPAAADAAFANGICALWSGHDDEAAQHLRRVRDLARGTSRLIVASSEYWLADLAYRHGRWDETTDITAALCSDLSGPTPSLVAPMAHSIASFVHSARGEFTIADDHLGAARRALSRTGASAGSLWLLVARARRHLAARDHRAAVETFATLASVLDGSELPEDVQTWRADHVAALVAAGRDSEARALLPDLGRRTRSAGPAVSALTAMAAGLVEAAHDERLAARANLEAALAHPVAEVGPFTRARIELAAGAVARRHGGRRAAADLLEASRARFAQLGAEPFRQQADRELAATARSRRPAGGAAGELTATETLVASLAARGRTNREVADELAISVKTVESHLSRVYTKMAVRSRTELANRWRRQHGTPDLS